MIRRHYGEIMIDDARGENLFVLKKLDEASNSNQLSGSVGGNLVKICVNSIKISVINASGNVFLSVLNAVRPDDIN